MDASPVNFSDRDEYQQLYPQLLQFLGIGNVVLQNVAEMRWVFGVR